MGHYKINFSVTGDPMTSFCAAIRVAQTLDLDYLDVNFPNDGFSIGLSKESRAVDIFEIYKLTVENKKLQKK